ncbi:MAG: tetratricopeptide repeat protein, partial [Pseudomonadota bacterium]
ALPEGQIRQFIQQILGGTDSAKEIEQILDQADAALQAGEAGQAAQMYAAVVEADPENLRALAGLARCYLANGDVDRAQQVLDMVAEDKQHDPAIKSVRTALSLMADTPLDDEMAEAREAVTANPVDHDARFSLAEKLAGASKTKDAVDHLLIILASDLEWGEGKAKAKLLEIFEAAGPKDPITVEGRRRLGSLMFA